MANKPTKKPFDWSVITKPAAKIMNEEAGVQTPAEAKQKKIPYWINRNGSLLDANDATHWQEVTKREEAESAQELKIDKDTKQHVMKQEYESKKYKTPLSSSATILRSIIEDKAKAKIAKQKATKPVEIDFSNNSALQDLEEFHQSRIEADARARRYHEYIKKTQDPDLHRGLAAVLGSIPADFKK